MTRVLVPLDGQWQEGDVVGSWAMGMRYFMTLGRDGWRESTPEEIRHYERVVTDDFERRTGIVREVRS